MSLGYFADGDYHQSDPHQDDEDEEDSLGVEGPLRAVVIVALALIGLDAAVPFVLVLDEATSPVLEDALEMDRDGDEDDIGEADDGSVEVDHHVQMHVEHINKIAGQHHTSNIEYFFPVDAATLIDLKHLEETQPDS